METNEDYRSVYLGFEVNVQHLQSIFEEEGISFRTKNDFQSGLRSGFAGEIPGQAQILVAKEDYAEAMRIVEETFPDEEE